jgi:adenylyl- and sulfurtransferase ThiI
MKDFDFELGAETIQGKIYIFTERIPGQGGLPVGVEGRVVAIVEQESDLLAAILMMKRGCAAIPVVFKAKKAKKPVIVHSRFAVPDCIEILEKHQGRGKRYRRDTRYHHSSGRKC